MLKSRFELGLRAQQAAERIGGKVMETEDGFVVETTIGGLTKYNISDLHTNLNTHCAVVGITRPMYDTDVRYRCRGVHRLHREAKVGPHPTLVGGENQQTP